MPARSTADDHRKAAVSISEMARMCSISRSHFHALIRSGVMPQPIYCIQTRRPFYDRDLQVACLRVRTTNIGVDGRFVLFYGPRSPSTAQRTGRRGRSNRDWAHLLEGLAALGMSGVTENQVQTAVRACFPSGTAEMDEGVVLRGVWQYLRRQI